ncbi:hypothetical protein E2C01_091248 [Portunus trituberculatus]|uniref:Uncharacterized protein n=1 Tax=Portunus trituberculatus TaxID=210409 RepID=A0A5B7JUI5_PORTR|nr:hypothetical protein [Portunus trituberculatus]
MTHARPHVMKLANTVQISWVLRVADADMGNRYTV